MISRVVVVIPARDEQLLIARCIESVQRAAEAVAVPVHITVVADGCLDNTVSIARSYGVEVLEIESSNVGTARRIGTERALGKRLRSTWIASTDADSQVPPNWLSAQLALAAQGADVVIGTVRPDFSQLSPLQIEHWQATHLPGEPNGHVHGANLGIRASIYARVGGYRDLPEHEDADLIERLQGYTIVASDEAEVLTSSRRVGRTPGGYARYLREMDETVAAAG